MTIGIIGSGAIGTAFARTLARSGIEAIISNSRGPDSLKELVRELGPSIRAGTREEAARADIVFVAVNWTKLQAALAGLPDWSGRILIDANNPIEAPLFKPVELKGRASSEVVAELAPGARVVKAFNHLRAKCSPGIRNRTAAGGFCSIRATTAPRKRKWQRSSNKSVSSELISDRSPSAAGSRNFPVARCPIRISSRSVERPPFHKRPAEGTGRRQSETTSRRLPGTHQ